MGEAFKKYLHGDLTEQEYNKEQQIEDETINAPAFIKYLHGSISLDKYEILRKEEYLNNLPDMNIQKIINNVYKQMQLVRYDIDYDFVAEKVKQYLNYNKINYLI